jgi:ribonuclease P protein subunit RPR2
VRTPELESSEPRSDPSGALPNPDHNRFPVSGTEYRRMVTVPEERIERLASLARDATREREFDRGREYVRLARRLAERNRCGLPRRFDRFTCDRCDAALVPGVNARVRLQEGSHVVIRCDCGGTDRYPYD